VGEDGMIEEKRFLNRDPEQEQEDIVVYVWRMKEYEWYVAFKHASWTEEKWTRWPT